MNITKRLLGASQAMRRASGRVHDGDLWEMLDALLHEFENAIATGNHAEVKAIALEIDALCDAPDSKLVAWWARNAAKIIDSAPKTKVTPKSYITRNQGISTATHYIPKPPPKPKKELVPRESLGNFQIYLKRLGTFGRPTWSEWVDSHFYRINSLLFNWFYPHLKGNYYTFGERIAEGEFDPSSLLNAPPLPAGYKIGSEIMDRIKATRKILQESGDDTDTDIVRATRKYIEEQLLQIQILHNTPITEFRQIRMTLDWQRKAFL